MVKEENNGVTHAMRLWPSGSASLGAGTVTLDWITFLLCLILKAWSLM
jgi:hypothetical protein